MSCPHNRKIGDNYGMTCADCGEVLEGYGEFARTRPKECLHRWEPMPGYEVCAYCEETRRVEPIRCKENLPVQVCSSQAGFYIGTMEPGQGPNCRISKYYGSAEQAARELQKMTFERRKCVENDWCGCNI